MCLFAKNAFLEWKRIEKKRKGRTFRKEETMFLSFLGKIVRRRIVKHKFFLPNFFVKKKSNNKESKHNERTHEERTNQEEEEVKRKSKENLSFWFLFLDSNKEIQNNFTQKDIENTENGKMFLRSCMKKQIESKNWFPGKRITRIFFQNENKKKNDIFELFF